MEEDLDLETPAGRALFLALQSVVSPERRLDTMPAVKRAIRRVEQEAKSIERNTWRDSNEYDTHRW